MSVLAIALFILPIAFGLHPARPVKDLVLLVVCIAAATAGALLGLETIRPRRTPGAPRIAAGIGVLTAVTSTASIALLVFLPNEYTEADIGISAAAVLGLPILLIASISAHRSRN